MGSWEMVLMTVYSIYNNKNIIYADIYLSAGGVSSDRMRFILVNGIYNH